MIVAEIFTIMAIGAVPVLIGWFLTRLVIRMRQRKVSGKHHHDSELTQPRLRLVAIKDGGKITFHGKD